MMIGNPSRWWNRRVPIFLIGAFCVVALSALFVWAFCGDFIHSIAWDLLNRRTATFRGQTLQVPWFWQEEKWTNYNEFELTRPYLLTPFPSSVTASFMNASQADVGRKIDTMRGGYAKLAQSLRGNFNPDASLDPHFICMGEDASGSQYQVLTCLSRDGRWSVSMMGLKQSIPEFEIILREVNNMGTPSK
jgi:hypothetical protein